MLLTVIQHLVVNLVRKQNQTMLARNLNHFQQNFFGVNSASRIVWIDHHNRFCAWCDFFTQIV